MIRIGSRADVSGTGNVMLAQISAVVTMLGVLVALVALILLHGLPTRLSPIRDAVSAYGISPYRGLYRTQTIATAVAAAALAVAVSSAVPSGSTLAVVFLAILAVARLIIGWFPMDAPGTSRTSTGRVHNLLAFAAFAAASVGGFMVGIAFANDPGLAPFADVSSILGWIMSAASVLTLLAAVVPALRGIFGLAERVIYLAMLAWLTYSAVVLLVA